MTRSPWGEVVGARTEPGRQDGLCAIREKDGRKGSSRYVT